MCSRCLRTVASEGAQAAGDLGVGVPGGDQVQQVPVPGGERGGRVTAALGVEVGLVQVRAQHGEQVAVAEVPAGPAEEDQPQRQPSRVEQPGSPLSGRR